MNNSNNPKAYTGAGSYIFISYAHKDADKVLPIVSSLIDGSYKVWYDEGIAPGSNWDEFISDKLEKCNCVLAFFSKSYFKSSNCCDELALARNKNKEISIINLDGVEPSPGIKLRYGRIQQLYLDNLSSKELLNKLYDTEAIAKTRK